MVAGLLPCLCMAATLLRAEDRIELFRRYCLDCHTGPDAEGDFDLSKKLKGHPLDATLIFENIATAKMPPANVDAPSEAERSNMLSWLADRQPETSPIPFRRMSRHEFVHSVNDLLGIHLDVAEQIPEDRGTRSFYSDRRIGLSRELLTSYFAIADEMLEHALPA
ncbi:MAG: DUF1587 domain-containing protein, partial [Pirellulales bacterium]